MYDTIKILGKNMISTDGFMVMWQHFKVPYESELHSHEFYEIELTISGVAEEYVNGDHFIKKRGTATVCTPMDFHSFSVSEDMDIVNILFSDRCLPEGISNQIFSKDTQRVFVLSEEKTNDLISLSKILDSIKNYNQTSKEELSKSVLDTILLILLSVYDSNEYKIKEGKMTDIEIALHYIDLHFAENPPASAVAQAIGKSPNYFSKYFKKCTGLYYINYLNARKVESAEMLLRTSDMSITDICYNCGFNSFSNFLRVFKNIKGVRPGEYRKNHRKLQEKDYIKSFHPK